MKWTFISIALILTSIQSMADSTVTVTATTFNLKWYGLGGAMWNNPEQEFRQTLLRRFIDEELPNTDLFVFTEVVKVDALQKMLESRAECISYEGGWSRHQHIVLCFNPKKFRAEKWDEDFIIPEVNLGSGGLRPALQAKICLRNGSCFLQVIGVHLVAGPKSEKRFTQMQLLKDAIHRPSKLWPTLIMGDFNSYTREQNGLEMSDMEHLSATLKHPESDFTSINEHIKSYSSGEWARTYDHIVVSTAHIKTLKTSGYPACQNQQDFTQKFIPYPHFRKYFSDHCPVTATIQIRNTDLENDLTSYTSPNHQN